MTDLELIDQYGQELEQVAEYIIKGELNPTKIAQYTKLPRAKVVGYIDAWKGIAQNDRGLKARVRENLTEMDRHFSMIIKELWAIVEDPDVAANVRATTLKSIADVEAKRQDTLQKAGIIESAGFADEVAEMDEKATAIKQLLLDVTKKYPETTTYILEGIKRVYKESPVVEGEVVA